MSRPISEAEALVIERVLEVGASKPISAHMLQSIRSLRVTANCQCGCATVWFGPEGEATIGHNLAEAVATNGHDNIGVIVWSQGDAIVGLELLGVGHVALPDPMSVRSFGDA